LRKKTGVKAVGMSGSSTSEVSTLQLEFKYLSFLTGDAKYAKATTNAMNILIKNEPPTSLVPIFISPETGKYVGDQIRLGSRGDSYYEYLYKQFHQIIDPLAPDIELRDMWTRAW
jgi:hypothetical protein